MKKFLPTSNILSVNKTSENLQGFTLVELLVVISILAILAVVGITVFSSTQKTARDTKRKADIEAISKALETHYVPGATNPYPNITPSWFADGSAPQPPQPTPYNYSALPGTSYAVCARLEDTTGNYNDSAATTPAPTPNQGSFFCRKNQQ